MDVAKSEAVAILKRVGLPDLAATAEAELPDPVSQDELVHWAQGHGITRDWLIERMGGSP